jgi:hypothetical protein
VLILCQATKISSILCLVQCRNMSDISLEFRQSSVYFKCQCSPVLRIQTLLRRIRILLFTLTRIRIRLFDTDPDPCCFKEVLYLKQYYLFLYIFTWFYLIFLVIRSNRTHTKGILC